MRKQISDMSKKDLRHQYSPAPLQKFQKGLANLQQRNYTAVKKFRSNMQGRDFVVGDIHGRFDIFKKLLSQAKFDVTRDRVFATGDLIDRGKLSHRATYWLSHEWFNSVRGNHEQMIINISSGVGDATRHARNGGAWFYRRTREEQHTIVCALLEMPIAIEVQMPEGPKIGIIHAELPNWELCDWESSTALLGPLNHYQHKALEQALYGRTKFAQRNASVTLGIEKIYVGHTTVPLPLQLGNTMYIDTGCSFSDGKLTMIELVSGTIYSCA